MLRLLWPAVGRSLKPQVLAAYSAGNPILHVPAASISFKQRKFKPHHKADGVAPRSDLVYANSSRISLYATYGVTSATVLPVVGITLWQLYTFADKLPAILSDLDQPVLPSLILASFGVCLLEAVRRVLRPGASRIYYDHSTETFTLVPLWTSITKRANIKFSPSDVSWRDNLGLFKEMTGNFIIKGQLVYILPKDFVHKSYFQLLTEEAGKSRQPKLD